MRGGEKDSRAARCTRFASTQGKTAFAQVQVRGRRRNEKQMYRFQRVYLYLPG